MLFYCFKELNIQRTIISFKELQFLNIFVQYFPAGLQVAKTQVSQKRPQKRNTFLRFSAILLKRHLESKVESLNSKLTPWNYLFRFLAQLAVSIAFCAKFEKNVKMLNALAAFFVLETTFYSNARELQDNQIQPWES